MVSVSDNSLHLQTIAIAQNGFVDKFGIPRQSQEGSYIETRIVFLEPFRSPEALRGIEGFSHLWLIWGFHDKNTDGWRPTVRPPRLGGNTRIGVFATRSPYRPNPIGLTSVRLLRVEKTQNEGMVLVVQGADLLDGTPVYDIKPYIPYTDSHTDALGGFAADGAPTRLPVVWTADTEPQDDKRRLAWEEILSQGPQPAYKHDSERIYKIRFAEEEIAYRAEVDKIVVEKRYIWQNA